MVDIVLECLIQESLPLLLLRHPIDCFVESGGHERFQVHLVIFELLIETRELLVSYQVHVGVRILCRKLLKIQSGNVATLDPSSCAQPLILILATQAFQDVKSD